MGDIDSDGDLDLVEGNYYVENRLWLNNSNTQGQAGKFIDSGLTPGIGNTVIILLGDIDGDGDVDLVIGNDGETEGQANEVFLNDY